MTLFQLTFFLVFISSLGWAKERHSHIGIIETLWDYAASGKNMLNEKTFSEDQDFQSQLYLQGRPDRIGSVYKKALYYQFTDDTFQEIVEKPLWLGYLGPILKAETGDFIYAHVKNMGSRSYSWHPHGLTYTKENEGAMYPDNTTGLQKEDDWVQPGETYTYKWYVEENQGPGPNDSNCVIRIYHSHIDTSKDVSSGLIGPLLTCKQGTLNGDDEKDIDKSYILLFFIMDENNSWYIDDNINTFTEPGRVNTSDPGFQESNRMRSINGYMYGNLPNLTMCTEDRVKWYFVGMGGVSDIHPIYLHGQTVIFLSHRTDTITVFPSSLHDAFMVAKGPGKWLLSCQIHESMQAFFEVRNCQNTSTNTTEGNVIHYYIAAEEIVWNYAPSGIDLFTGEILKTPGSESNLYFEQNATRIGRIYKKAVYREYTDISFKTPKAREEHLGILGPVIRAQVGDTIRVTFYNNASKPLNMQPHGLHYSNSNEGLVYKTPGERTTAFSSRVSPGTRYMYTWKIHSDAGPTSTDPDCLSWIYYSSVDRERDTNSGLVGPLLLCKSGSLTTDGKQKGVDKQFFILSTIFDENESYLLNENIRSLTTNPENVDKDDSDFQDSNKMYSINGYIYGNLPGLDMCVGDNVVWHVLSVGSISDLHGIYFSGNTFVSLGSRMDTVTVFPHTSQTLSMTPDSTGIFDVVCMTAEHYQGGMKHKYRVRQCSKENTDQTHYQEVKTIYIAAEEIIWDYSPSRKWEKQLHHLQRKKNQTNIYLDKVGTFLGSRYKKVVYHQYDDATFTNKTKRNENEKHLDILGPMIISKPGQIIQVVFKNQASRPYSIHAHGVTTNHSTIIPTKPGEIHTYIWQIAERSGPTSQDFECIPWIYYSTVDFVKDLNSGLVGPLIVCHENANLNIVHRVLLFMIFNENKSWYFEENISTYSSDPNNIDREDDEFNLSNQMHAINGRMFGNNQGLTVHTGDEVNWYLIGIGGEADMHTVHFHGHSFQYVDSGLYRSDVYDLPPGTFRTVKMFPRDVGTWLFHCHVFEHIDAGMESTYTVVEREA